MSDDEYKDFLNISNQLLEIFPQLYGGINDNGDAFLKLSGDTDTIVSSLDALIEKERELANIKIIQEIPKVFNGVNAEVDNYNKQIEDNKTERQKAINDYKDKYYKESGLGMFLKRNNKGIAEQDDNGNFSLKDTLSIYGDDVDKYEEKLKELGITYEKVYKGYEVLFKYDADLINKSPLVYEFNNGIQGINYEYDQQLKLLKDKITQSYQNINKITQAWLEENFQYINLSEPVKNIIDTMVAGLDFQELGISTEEAMDKYITNYILNPLYNMSPDVREAFGQLFDMKDKLTNGEITSEEFSSYATKMFDDLITGMGESAPKFKQLFMQSFIDAGIKGDTFDEVVQNLIDSWNTAVDDNSLELKSIGTFEKYSEALDKIQDAYSTVSNAIDEYKENQYLSLDTLQSLLALDDKYLATLFDENGQLQLNKQTYIELTKARLMDMYAALQQQTLDVISSLNSEKEAMKYLQISTENSTEANWNFIASEFAKARQLLDEEDLKTGDPTKTQKRRDALLQAEDALTTRANLLKDAYNNIGKNLDGMMDSTASAKKKIKDFAEVIDWLENSVNNLSNAIDELDNKFNNENLIYKERGNILGELIKKQKELISLEKNGIVTYRNDYNKKLNALGGNNKKYQSLIESNTAINLEDFTDEDIYNAVVNARDAWNKYQEQIKKYNDEMSKYEDYQVKDYEIRISSYDNIISRLENSNKDRQNSIDLKKAKGEKIEENDYQEIIDENKKIISKNQDKLSEVMTERNKYPKNSERYKELDNDVQEVQDNISQLKQEQIDLNREILKIPIQVLEDEKEVLEEQLKVIQEKEEKLNTSINTASNYIGKQIEYYNDLKDTTSDSYDAQIKVWQDKIDLLNETNDEIKQQMVLEKAKYEFEKATQNRNVKIYREGQGFVYEADQEAVKESQQNLDEELFNKTIQGYEKEIDILEKAKEKELEYLNTQIESLENYKELLDDISSSYEEMLGLQQLVSQYGTDVIERLNNKDTSLINQMQNDSINIQSEKTKTEEKIENIDNSIEKINKLAEGWNGTAQTIRTTKAEIQKIVTDNTEENRAIEERITTVENLAKQWGTNKTSIKKSLDQINTDYIGSAEEEKEILDKRLEYLKSFAAQAQSYLSSITSSLNEAKEKENELNSISESNARKDIQIDSTTKENVNKTKSTANSNVTMGLKKLTKHTGMKTGFVGENLNDTDKDKFRYIALNKLKPDEIPTILQLGESVLTNRQQSNVMNNIQSAFMAGAQHIPNIQKNNSSIVNSISFNGDIVIEKVNGNVDEFAQKIKSEFLLRLEQQLFKL